MPADGGKRTPIGWMGGWMVSGPDLVQYEYSGGSGAQPTTPSTGLHYWRILVYVCEGFLDSKGWQAPIDVEWRK